MLSVKPASGHGEPGLEPKVLGSCRKPLRLRKPSNILLTADGTLKLCDFGLCRLVKEAEPGAYTTRVITLWHLGHANVTFEGRDAGKSWSRILAMYFH